MELPLPRRQYIAGKYAVARLALFEPDLFVELCTGEGADARLAGLWAACGDGLPAEECGPADGFTASSRGPEDAPVVLVTFPPAERRNEAHLVAAVPVESSGGVEFRVFGLERAVWPETGEWLAFVVEWGRRVRHNYGPPADDRPGDTSVGGFMAAILDIAEGRRKPLFSAPMDPSAT